MQGMCSSPLPVGVAAYIASAPSQKDAASAQLTHPVTQATAQASRSHELSQGTLATPRAASRSPQASVCKHSSAKLLQVSQSKQLGIYANAAWDPTPELAGCGPLLPSWRQIVDLLIPLLHKVGQINLTAHVSQVAVVLQ